MSYREHKKNKMGDIINDIIKEPGNVTFNFTIPSFTIIFELFTVIILLILCLFIDYKVTLISGGFFCTVSFVMLFLTKVKIAGYSAQRFNNDQSKGTVINNALNNFIMQKFSPSKYLLDSFKSIIIKVQWLSLVSKLFRSFLDSQ